MKIKRYKKVSRRLNFFTNNFGFRQPYQLLIDGTFCLAALNNKINIADNIPRYLHGELKLITTQCALIEAESLGRKVSGACIILKQYILHKCGHEGKPVTGAKCFLSMVSKNNENHYVIATQDKELQEEMRKIPGVPLLFLHSRAPILDEPSKASTEYVKGAKAGLAIVEKQKIEKMKEKQGIPCVSDNFPKKKKVKGPNPLSCKKKKKFQNSTQKAKDKVVGPKGNRRKVRIPQHVKEALYKNVAKLAENKE